MLCILIVDCGYFHVNVFLGAVDFQTLWGRFALILLIIQDWLYWMWLCSHACGSVWPPTATDLSNVFMFFNYSSQILLHFSSIINFIDHIYMEPCKLWDAECVTSLRVKVVTIVCIQSCDKPLLIFFFGSDIFNFVSSSTNIQETMMHLVLNFEEMSL